MEPSHSKLFDGDKSTGATLWNLLQENTSDERMLVTASFASDTSVDEIIIRVNEPLWHMINSGMITVDVEALPTIDLDDYPGHIGISRSNILGERCLLIDPQSRLHRFSATNELIFDCQGFKAASVKVSIGLHLGRSTRYKSSRINEIEAFGFEEPSNEEQLVTSQFDLATQFTSVGLDPTQSPPQVESDQVDVLQNAIPSVIEESSSNNYKVVWRPSFGTPISYNKLMASVSSNSVADTNYAKNSVISFLTTRGYLDYVLAEDGTASTFDERSRTKVRDDDLINSIRLLQKFNGFPETGEASKDIFAFVTEPRCGVSDVEFNKEDSEEENKLCFTLYRDEKIRDSSVSSCHSNPLNRI